MRTLYLILALGIWSYAQAQEATAPPAADTPAPATKPKSSDTQFFMGILLDQITTASPLKAAPSREDPKKYYYLPNKVRIATDETTGKPKFSFVRYVTNLRSATEDTDLKEGEGGGWVHLVMGLSVSQQEIMAAESELQRKVPGAKLIGPAIYRSGTVTLVTKSAATSNKPQILGIGPAPILDGDFLAVGFSLDAKDAAILWETLLSPNPDVSLNFSMDLAGFNSPVGAKVEVNWNMMKKHRLMNIDADVPIMRAQISDMVIQLKRDNTIKITTYGQNAMADRLLAKVEDKIIARCFTPATQILDSLAKTDRASNYLLTNKNLDDKKDSARADERADLVQDKASLTTAQQEATAAEAAAKTAKDNAIAAEEERQRTQLKEKVDKLEKELSQRQGELATAPSRSDSSALEAKIKELKEKVAGVKTAQEKLEQTFKENKAQRAAQEVEKLQVESRKAQEKVKKLEERVEDARGITTADFAVQAMYHRAKVSFNERFTMDLNSYDPVVIKETFGGNIGKINCRECMLEVNTASALYTQRELVARLDGEAAKNDNFDKYINYVTVRIRKKHGGGDLTLDEVRIDRKNFNKDGNVFKMLYGWQKGDNDRRNWHNYDYQTSWSFFGGYQLNENWRPTNSQMIALSPPFQRSEVKILAESETLLQASVRMVFVKIFYRMGNVEYVKRATINPKSVSLEQTIDVLHTQNELAYEYEIDWLLNDGSSLKSSRQGSTNQVIFVDILPTKN